MGGRSESLPNKDFVIRDATLTGILSYESRQHLKRTHPGPRRLALVGPDERRDPR